MTWTPKTKLGFALLGLAVWIWKTNEERRTKAGAPPIGV